MGEYYPPWFRALIGTAVIGGAAVVIGLMIRFLIIWLASP